MQIHKIDLRLSDNPTSPAFGTIYFSEYFGIRISIRVTNGRTWISWPSYKTNKIGDNGKEFWNEYVVIDKELKDTLNKQVLDHLNGLLSVINTPSLPPSPPEEPQIESNGKSRVWATKKR